MNDYISLSTLNDFIFCPYSIYLHNVYMETADDMYKAVPQIEGKLSHQGVDNKTGTSIVSSNFVSADFRKMRTDSFQKSRTTRFRKIRVVR